MADDFDFIDFKARALEALKAGKPLTGKDGVLGPLLENLLNAALEGEMDAHMSATPATVATVTAASRCRVRWAS